MTCAGRKQLLLVGVLLLVRVSALVDESTQLVGVTDRVEVLAVDILQRSRIVGPRIAGPRSGGAGVAVELSEGELFHPYHSLGKQARVRHVECGSGPDIRAAVEVTMVPCTRHRGREVPTRWVPHPSPYSAMPRLAVPWHPWT